MQRCSTAPGFEGPWPKAVAGSHLDRLPLPGQQCEKEKVQGHGKPMRVPITVTGERKPGNNLSVHMT